MNSRNKKSHNSIGAPAIPVLLAVFLLLGSVLLLNRTPKEEGSSAPIRREFFAMDTYMTLTLYGATEGFADRLEAEVHRLDDLLSTGNPESEVYALNNGETVSCSPDVLALYEKSIQLYRRTQGAFDITVYPLMEAWGFTDSRFRIPTDTTLAALLSHVDTKLLPPVSDTLTLPEDVRIDFGGIAKGYTAQLLQDLICTEKLRGAVLDLGGNIQLVGEKPDGTPFRIGVKDPFDTDNNIGVLSCSDCAIVTSGGYERFFEENETVYHHILDPRTGYPAENGLKSVTIVCPDGTLADGYSTSLFILGPEKAIALWRDSKDFEAIFVTSDNRILVTEGLRDAFSSSRSCEIIQRED